MFRKKDENRKRNENKKRKHAGWIAAAICLGVIFYTTPVFASGIDQVTKPIDQLKTLFIAVGSGIGVIFVIKSIIELGTAFSQQDMPSIRMALLGLIGGAMIAAVGALLAFFGF